MQIAILGRETELARAEVETISNTQECISPYASLFEAPVPTEGLIDRLGSVIKIGEVLERIPGASATDQIISAVCDSLKTFGDRKISFGISAYGKRIFTDQIQRSLALQLKKTLQKKFAVPIRYIRPKDGGQLNAAQIIHNDLLSRGGDFLVVESGSEIVVARTVAVQDVSSYSKRDYSRPCRDAKVGMFPPKLAQTLLNLSSAQAGHTVVDPFCGSGVVLQEALLLGYKAYGADNSSEMIRCSRKNLEWLSQEFGTGSKYELQTQDATKLSLPDVIANYVVVTEGYLGRPLSQPPDQKLLANLRTELEPLYQAFLANLREQSSCPQTVVLCLPVWQTQSDLQTLKIVDQIAKLGYTMKQFQSVDSRNLIYKRKNQIVGRQILVLKPTKATKVRPV